MLYEVLTGRLPIRRTPAPGPRRQADAQPLPPSSIVPGVPEDLDALCTKLLRFDPVLRPSAADVLRSVSVTRASGSALRPEPWPRRRSSSGASAELAELRDAFDGHAERASSATVLVCGESGDRQVVPRPADSPSSSSRERPETLLLEGTVLRARDRAVQDDRRDRRRAQPALVAHAPPEAGALLPTRCAVLAQVFPVMLRVPQVAKEHAARATATEPHELRQRAFAALRDLFTRVAARRPTVVVIDDLQWADDDGLRALGGDPAPAGRARRFSSSARCALASGTKTRPLQRLRAVVPDEPRVLHLANLGPGRGARRSRSTLLERSGTQRRGSRRSSPARPAGTRSSSRSWRGTSRSAARRATT